MRFSRIHRFILLSALWLTMLLPAAPSAFASSLQSSSQTACPSITGFTPTSGTPGTSVTISGCGFTRASKVAFHGVSASFTVNAATQITATVPAGASTSVIAVTISTGTVLKSTSKFIVPPAVTLAPSAGPPGSLLSVSGSNFGSYEAVDIYFDTTDEALAATTAQGTFSGISIPAPASAVPGTHWVTAVGRHSGLSAQTSFTVQTNWSQFHNTPSRTGFNRSENVLSPANVAGLDMDWSVTTGNAVESSPAVVNGVVYVGSDDNSFYAFNAQTGTRLWSAPTRSPFFSSPAVANGVVYVGSDDAHLYAYALPSPNQPQPPIRPNPASLHPNFKLPLQS